MAKNQHVVPQTGKWAVKGAGNQRATRVVATQLQAMSIARDIARRQGSDVVIFGRDGRVCDKDSYGNDPFTPRDAKR